jgi:hypothetical protein
VTSDGTHNCGHDQAGDGHSIGVTVGSTTAGTPNLAVLAVAPRQDYIVGHGHRSAPW